MSRVRLPSIPLDGERRGIFGWSCVLIFVNQLGFGAIIPVVPLYAQSFGVDATAIGLTIAVYGLARFLVAIPASRIADSHGRRWTLALGGVLTVVGNLACAVAPDYTIFLIARFVAGAGASMVLTGSQIVLADIAPPHVRGRILATYQGVFLFAVGAGALPGGLLAEHFGLATPFVAYSLLAAIVSFIALRRVPETRNYRSGAPAQGSTQPMPAPLAFGEQMRTIWGTPGLLWIGFVSFTAFFARTGGLFNVVPLLAEDEMNLSPDQIGLGLGLVSIAGLLFTVPAGILVDRLGRKPVIVPSALMSATAMLVFAFAPNFAWYVVACAWWGTSSGISGAAPAAYAADTARAGQTAATLGAYRMIADSGYVLGPLLLGVIADVGSPEAALWFCTGLSLVAGIGFWRFAPETYPRRSAHPPPDSDGVVPGLDHRHGGPPGFHVNHESTTYTTIPPTSRTM